MTALSDRLRTALGLPAPTHEMLTAGEVRARVARATAKRPADLRGCALVGLNLEGIELRHVVFGTKAAPGEPAPALVRQTSLRGATIAGCSFVDVEFDGVNLRDGTLTDCDLRYAAFRRCTFHGRAVELCDFYRAIFETGVIFGSATLRHVSLDRASLDGTVDLRIANLPDGLLQEDRAATRKLLVDRGLVAPEDIDAEADRHLDVAATTWRTLSGVWSAQGAFSDAAEAYLRSRHLERRAASPLRGYTRTRPLRWAALWVAGALTGFGERVWRILATVVAIAVLPALAYGAWDGVTGPDGRPVHNGWDLLLFSVGQLTTTAPDDLTAAARWSQALGEAQTLLGIAALGLLGFVLGNRIRQS